MKAITMCLSALLICTAAVAQNRTEIVVREGLVKTMTDRGDSLVKAGQTAVMKDGQEPTISFNNKIVEKLLQLDQQIQAERAEGLDKIVYTSAQVYSVDQEDVIKVGATMTMPNPGNQASNTCRVGTMSVLQDVSFYDFQGNPLQYTIEKVKADEGYYYLQFPKSVVPGGEFQFVLITNFQQTIEDFQLLKKVDGLWILSGHNDTPYCLNYFHAILPKAAIFVKSEPAAGVIEEQDGRIGVSVRNYTGPQANGGFSFSFLWPEKDGTSLKGIPWTDAGPEAVEIYELFLREDIQSPALWGELAIKLVGGQFYAEAFDAFERCFNGHKSPVWDYTALTWQGHLYDLWGQREAAVEKYRQALASKPEDDMRHDQWGIVLTRDWVRRRLKTPFRDYMLTYPELSYREARETGPLDPLMEPGVRIGSLYLGVTKEEVLSQLGEPVRIFLGEKTYTPDNLPEHYYMVYSDLGLFIQDNQVRELTARSPFYHLPNGIRIGDTEQKVIETYGTGFQLEQLPAKDYLRYTDVNLTFEIDKEKRTILEINLEP